MPYFRVMLDGKGIDVPVEAGGPSIIGFITTRLVRAATVAEAEKKAKDMILSEWSSSIYASVNRGSLPVLSVEAVYQSSFWDSLRFRNKGYSFYAQEDGEQTNVNA